jgi:hypothetical protein
VSRYQASFKIDSKSDSYAIRRILEKVYDTVREESRTVRENADDTTALLGEFETLRDAAQEPSPGELRIVYERYDDEFGD